jgi:hypothetical protein
MITGGAIWVAFTCQGKTVCKSEVMDNWYRSLIIIITIIIVGVNNRENFSPWISFCSSKPTEWVQSAVPPGSVAKLETTLTLWGRFS